MSYFGAFIVTLSSNMGISALLEILQSCKLVITIRCLEGTRMLSGRWNWVRMSGTRFLYGFHDKIVLFGPSLTFFQTKFFPPIFLIFNFCPARFLRSFSFLGKSSKGNIKSFGKICCVKCWDIDHVEVSIFDQSGPLIPGDKTDTQTEILTYTNHTPVRYAAMVKRRVQENMLGLSCAKLRSG